MSDFKIGSILVANPELDFDPFFARSVILLIEYEDELIIGVNLAGEQLEDLVLMGGPEGDGTMRLLFKTQNVDQLVRQIESTGYAILKAGNNGVSKEESRQICGHRSAELQQAFFGRGSWSIGSLGREMRLGAWAVSNVDLDTLFAVPSTERWQVAARGTPFEKH